MQRSVNDRTMRSGFSISQRTVCGRASRYGNLPVLPPRRAGRGADAARDKGPPAGRSHSRAGAAVW
jgi:hypothetical protein